MTKRATFGERFESLRIQNGLSQTEIATKFGKTKQAASSWARGTIPREPILSGLANLFGVSTDYLLGIVDERASEIISDLDNKKVKYADLTEAQKKMINRMDELSSEEQENLYDIADNFLKLSEKRIKK